MLLSAFETIDIRQNLIYNNQSRVRQFFRLDLFYYNDLYIIIFDDSPKRILRRLNLLMSRIRNRKQLTKLFLSYKRNAKNKT